MAKTWHEPRPGTILWAICAPRISPGGWIRKTRPTQNRNGGTGEKWWCLGDFEVSPRNSKHEYQLFNHEMVWKLEIFSMKRIEMVDLTDLTNDLTMKHGGKGRIQPSKLGFFTNGCDGCGNVLKMGYTKPDLWSFWSRIWWCSNKDGRLTVWFLSSKSMSHDFHSKLLVHWRVWHHILLVTPAFGVTISWINHAGCTRPLVTPGKMYIISSMHSHPIDQFLPYGFLG